MKTYVFIAKGINTSCVVIESIAYILLEDKKELIQLNDIGTYIWQQIDGRNRISDIIQCCLQEYGGDVGEISEAVINFLKILETEHLIKISGVPFEEVMCDVR